MTMTPEERQRVEDLLERLESLEGQPRDPEAARLIAAALARAPNAIYPLVQTVLVQDEALQMAEERIRELGGAVEEPQQQRGFLDNVREALLGPDPQRQGSVPQVRPSAWGNQQQPTQPMQQQQPTQDYGSRGGSFLGTAAATAAGVIGGSMLFNSLGSMFGGDKAHAGTQSFGDTGKDTPWGGARDSDMAREAGLSDIGGGREDRSGWFDTAQNFGGDLDNDSGFDAGGDGGGDGGGGGGD
jgi:hypothetical protein